MSGGIIFTIVIVAAIAAYLGWDGARVKYSPPVPCKRCGHMPNLHNLDNNPPPALWGQVGPELEYWRRYPEHCRTCETCLDELVSP